MMDDEGENVIDFPGPTASAPEPSHDDIGEPDGPCPPELLVLALEACLFASADPRTPGELAMALGVATVDVFDAVESLRERYLRSGSALRVVEVGDGYQIRTDARLARWVAAIRGGKPFRLSRPALETLSVIAFRQPASKGLIDDIRGVDTGGIIRSLLERGLVKMAGRSEEPGKPMLYATTPAFLEVFGLRSLADLPTLRDLRPLHADDPETGPVPVVPFRTPHD